ncbi:DUF2798 domain-containing protein [Paraglaciecola chathamensis]|jgi:hypothetical protein|uniref:DUF2798 domain-containing protein n=2 Tax=Paraglaciecola chathamensis TaxID=368405 RepID=A0A8H9I8K3_9ALTE|nr:MULTISPECIES: DUF2798 domain-containing protein [Paraglaciecola]AEE22452.1 hypothetical protein Glaag_1495 [Glaciecola sp. 4H-3-7+YE-5]GGZ54728.1 hypothetical protein GCM10011274_10920 [Paraglaciecola oceanifecundans]
MSKDNIANSRQSLLRTTIMAFTMSGVLSLYWTCTNIGVPDVNALLELFWAWLRAWGESIVIALPTSLLLGPWINHYVANPKAIFNKTNL